jgi:succinate dehydrogenase / fumarate reductase flavoprotein subunit
LHPFEVQGGENPYTIQKDLQDVMQRLVGIIRKREELVESLVEIAKLKERAKHLSVEGHRQYNPGWHLALDLANMLVVSECIAKAALEREESRGGHTRDDFPGPDDRWGALNLVLTLPPGSDEVDLRHQPLPAMPEDLKKLFDQ